LGRSERLRRRDRFAKDARRKKKRKLLSGLFSSKGRRKRDVRLVMLNCRPEEKKKKKKSARSPCCLPNLKRKTACRLDHRQQRLDRSYIRRKKKDACLSSPAKKKKKNGRVFLAKSLAKGRRLLLPAWEEGQKKPEGRGGKNSMDEIDVCETVPRKKKEGPTFQSMPDGGGGKKKKSESSR